MNLWCLFSIQDNFLPFQCLLVAKLVAAILSGSISVISSLVDSCVDLSSGFVIAVTERAMRKRDLYEYPQGLAQDRILTDKGLKWICISHYCRPVFSLLIFIALNQIVIKTTAIFGKWTMILVMLHSHLLLRQPLSSAHFPIVASFDPAPFSFYKWPLV